MPFFQEVEVVVIGAGPAGLAAALSVQKEGGRPLLIERSEELGGILNQCIHNGFGLHEFGEELTGPEYAQRFIEQIKTQRVPVLLNAMVLSLTADHELTVACAAGLLQIKAKAVVFATGCRERTAGAIALPGVRPSGIYTAGFAQKMANEEGYLVGREVVIYGSGDIGLIMARRMSLEGAKVRAVVEIMPHSSGLARNVAQCLEDFDIPLKCSTAIAAIHGHTRVEAVSLVRVDEQRRPIPGSQEEISCDTLLLSVGLIPEIELPLSVGIGLDPKTGGPAVDSALMCDQPGFFSCGNVLHVHDVVDFVTKEGRQAGVMAARYAKGRLGPVKALPLQAGEGIASVVPQRLRCETQEPIPLFLRAKNVVRGAKVILTQDGRRLQETYHRILLPSEMIQTTLSPEAWNPQGGAIEATVEGNHD